MTWKAPELKPKPCKQCQSVFMPARAMQAVCSPTCARRIVLAENKAKKEAAKQSLQARKEKLETIPQLIRKAQHEFNAFIRARDAGKPCICCGQPLGVDSVGGGYDCGHYRSVGSASHLRFDERNAHAQRKVCNRYGAGRAVDYRLGLIGRLGLEAVEALESDNTPVKWERDVLRQIAVIYRAKYRALLKERQ